MRRLASALALTVALALGGCTTMPPPGIPDAPRSIPTSPFTVNGTFTFGLGGATKQQFPDGSLCDLQDPLQGSVVSVSDQSGGVIATTRLGPGTTSWAANQGECTFIIRIAAVPAGPRLYRLHVDGFRDVDHLDASDLQDIRWMAERT